MLTTVFPVLRFQEFTDALAFDKLQVLLHTHVIVFTVPFINALDLGAGILFAFVTESRFPANDIVIYPGAFPEKVHAGLIAGPATDALAAFQVVDIRQVIAAERAIHPAGCDQVFSDWIWWLYSHKKVNPGTQSGSFCSQKNSEVTRYNPKIVK